MWIINLDAVAATLEGIVYLLIGLWALLRPGAQRRAAHALTVYAGAGLLGVGTGLLRYAGWPGVTLPSPLVAILPFFGLSLIAPAYWHFTRAFLRLEGRAIGWWLGGLVWLGGGLLLEAGYLRLPQVLAAGAGWSLTRTGLVMDIAVLGWAVYMAAAVLATYRAHRRTRQPLSRNRIKYLAPVALLLVASEALFLGGLRPWGHLTRLFAGLLAAYATLVHYLPSLRRAFLRVVSYLATTGLAFVFGVGLWHGLWRVYRSIPPIFFWPAGLLLAAVFAMLLLPLLNSVMRIVDQLVAGASRDPSHVLRRYSQSISNILDLQRLSQVIVELTGEAMGVERGFLFLVNLERGESGQATYRLHGVQSGASDPPPSGELLESSPLAAYLRHERKLLSRDNLATLPRFGETRTTELHWLAALEMEIYVPIYTKEAWIGLLALGPKSSGAPYLEEDHFLLSTLADQTAVALENARLVESLTRLNNDFRRAIAALDQANRTLELQDRTKSEFIRVASHELRTPLDVLSGHSQRLLDDPHLAHNEEAARLLQGIHNSAERLHEILDSMLDIARIESREMDLKPQPVELRVLCQELYRELRPALDARHQSYELRGLDSLPPVEADRDALRKVFYHLLVNAIKFTPDGGKITIGGRSIAPDPESWPEGGVELVVRDTGIGIDPRHIDAIFTKFYQTGELAGQAGNLSAGKIRFKGSGPGLGLAIAKGIVEAHRGRIWAESAAHNEVRCPGSRFFVQLPLRHRKMDLSTPPPIVV